MFEGTILDPTIWRWQTVEEMGSASWFTMSSYTTFFLLVGSIVFALVQAGWRIVSSVSWAVVLRAKQVVEVNWERDARADDPLLFPLCLAASISQGRLQGQHPTRARFPGDHGPATVQLEADGTGQAPTVQAKISLDHG